MANARHGEMAEKVNDRMLTGCAVNRDAQQELIVVTVLFNAFSFLQKRLKEQNRPYADVPVKLADESTVADLVVAVGLQIADVEAVLINGSVQPFDTTLHDGDRVALIPPGTPGPYRVLLGMVGGEKGR